MSECRCALRDGAHEWHCGHVGEYEHVHCKECDKPVWMATMQTSLCPACRDAALFRAASERAVKNRLLRCDCGGE